MELPSLYASPGVIKEFCHRDGTGWTYGRGWRNEYDLIEKPRGKDIRVPERIILKMYLKEIERKFDIALIWLSMWVSGGIF
jgi:hypothetical protein